MQRLRCFEQLLAIAVAQRFGAIGDPAFAAFGFDELGAAVVGQRFLGGVEDLHEMAR